MVLDQPPSGGCVLKRQVKQMEYPVACQPPSGGCVLKLLKRKTANRQALTSRLRAAVC